MQQDEIVLAIIVVLVVVVALVFWYRDKHHTKGSMTVGGSPAGCGGPTPCPQGMSCVGGVVCAPPNVPVAPCPSSVTQNLPASYYDTAAGMTFTQTGQCMTLPPLPGALYVQPGTGGGTEASGSVLVPGHWSQYQGPSGGHGGYVVTR